MADQPDHLALRLLRDIGATQDVITAAQDVHGASLGRLETDVEDVKRKIEDLYKISTHTLGVAANAHVRYEELEAQVRELTRRVTKLETAR